MSYTEALERLLGEIQKLTAKVEALDERLKGLEETGAAAAPPPPAHPATQREGAFGPMVQRSDPTRHQRAVEQAKALNGSAPAEEHPAAPGPAPEEQSGGALQSHQRALQRIREMQGKRPAPEPQPEPEPEIRWETDREEADPELDLSEALPVDLIRTDAQD